MLRNLVLIAGTVVIAVGCEEMSQGCARDACCGGSARSNGCSGGIARCNRLWWNRPMYRLWWMHLVYLMRQMRCRYLQSVPTGIR